MTNNELALISEIIEYLSTLGEQKGIYFSNELDKMYYKYSEKRKDSSKRANDYNKENRKKHLILNQIYYHRKKNNQAKVKELIEKYHNIKNV